MITSGVENCNQGDTYIKNATEFRTLVTLAYNTKFKWENQVKKADCRFWEII
jgi:hypothetical protein